MKLLYFFDDKIKPGMMKGKKYCNPVDTSVIGDGISCIREYDVNFWLYTKDGMTIAIDSGHLNFNGASDEFRKIGIRPDKIENVFLTHADVDHAGGVDICGMNIFPNAGVYLGAKEEAYVKGEIHRMTKLGIRLNNCVRLCDGYKLLEDGDIVRIGNIQIQAIHIPGHTLGHMCYLVDDTVLFSGDCIAVNQTGGYSFFDFFTQYPDMNKASLHKLYEMIKGKNIRYICTGHNGIWTDMDHVFSHIDESAKFSKRYPFDEAAPWDYTK